MIQRAVAESLLIVKLPVAGKKMTRGHHQLSVKTNQGVDPMKDAYEVLHQKEAEFARVRKEVESLNLVVGLLTDDDDQGDFANLGDSKKPANSVTDTISRQSDLSSTSAHRPFSAIAESRLQWPNLTKATR